MGVVYFNRRKVNYFYSLLAREWDLFILNENQHPQIPRSAHHIRMIHWEETSQCLCTRIIKCSQENITTGIITKGFPSKPKMALYVSELGACGYFSFCVINKKNIFCTLYHLNLTWGRIFNRHCPRVYFYSENGQEVTFLNTQPNRKPKIPSSCMYCGLSLRSIYLFVRVLFCVPILWKIIFLCVKQNLPR